jgi:hypothetical protein
MVFLYFEFQFSWKRHGKTKDFEVNDSKHSLNLTCFKFLRKCNSDMLLSIGVPPVWGLGEGLTTPPRK